MPQIPTFDSQVNLHPGGAAQQSPAAMAQVGEALRRVGDEQTDIMASFLQRRTEAVRAADAAHYSAQASQSLGDLEFKWSKVPDREQAQSGFDSEAAQARQKLLDGIKDPYVQSHVSQSFDQQMAVRRHTTANAAFGQESATRNAQRISDNAKLAESAANASSEVLRSQLMDSAVAATKGAVAAGWTDPVAGEKEIQKFRSDVQEVQARKLTDQVIDAQDGGAAHALAARLSDPEEFKGLFPERRESLLGRLENLGNTLDRRAIAQQAHRDALAERQLHQAQGHNEAVLLAGIAGGKMMSPSAIQHLADTQQISAGGVEALVSANNRQENGIDDPDAALRLWHAIGTKTATSGMIFDGMHGGQISRNTATTMMRSLDSAANKQDGAIEKQTFAQLKTALHGGAIDQGIIPNKSPVAALWTQAQGEWAQRVTVGGENPQGVLKDMLPRYAHDTASPTWLPQPKLGLVQSPQDLSTVAARTGAAFKSGNISQSDYDAQLRLLSQYKQFYPIKTAPKPGASQGGKP